MHPTNKSNRQGPHQVLVDCHGELLKSYDSDDESPLSKKSDHFQIISERVEEVPLHTLMNKFKRFDPGPLLPVKTIVPKERYSSKQADTFQRHFNILLHDYKESGYWKEGFPEIIFFLDLVKSRKTGSSHWSLFRSLSDIVWLLDIFEEELAFWDGDVEVAESKRLKC